MRWDFLAWLVVLYFVIIAIKGIIFDYQNRKESEELEEYYERRSAVEKREAQTDRDDAERMKAKQPREESDRHAA